MINGPMQLKNWLKSSGLRQYELAEKLGVTPATITNLLDGSQNWVSRGLAEALARVTDGQVTALDFLDADEASKPTQPQEAAE